MQRGGHHQAERHVADALAHHALALHGVGHHVRQGTIVANAARQVKLHTLFDALVHDAGLQHALVDGRGNRTRTADAIDRPQVVLVSCVGKAAFFNVHSQAGAEQRLLDVVSGQRVAGKQLVDVAVAQQLADESAAAGVHDRRAAHQQRLAGTLAVLEQLPGDLSGSPRLWVSPWRPRCS